MNKKEGNAYILNMYMCCIYIYMWYISIYKTTEHFVIVQMHINLSLQFS